MEPELSLVLLLCLPEDTLILKLRHLGILTPMCEKCGGEAKDKVYRRLDRDGPCWFRRCADWRCHTQISLHHASAFDIDHVSCRVPIKTLLVLLISFLQNDKLADIAVKAGLNENTVTKYCHHLRIIVAFWAEANEKPLGGPGIQVEVDETSIASETFMKRDRPHLQYFRWMGLIKRGTHHLVLHQLPAREQKVVDKPGKVATMSAGVAYYKPGQLPRLPPPPPLSNDEAQPFMQKFLLPGTEADPVLLFANTASAYNSLINGSKKKRGIFGRQAECHQVAHGREEWTRTDVSMATATPVKVGSQLIDGTWISLKNFLRPHHGLRHDLELHRLWVRSWQWIHSVGQGQNLLRAFGN